MTYAIYERGAGRLIEFEADDMDEAIDEGLEALALGERPGIDRPETWLTLVRASGRRFQIVGEGRGEQPWK